MPAQHEQVVQVVGPCLAEGTVTAGSPEKC
jgi:hypothetical protein